MRNVSRRDLSRTSLLWMSRTLAIGLLPLLSLVITPTPPALACGRVATVDADVNSLRLDNGLQLGLLESDVAKLLGKPKERRRQAVRCPSSHITLTYPAGKIVLDRDSRSKSASKESQVVTIIATNSDWVFPQGGRVGDTYEQVIQRYGKSDNAPNGKQRSYLRYYLASDYVLDMALSPQGKVIWLRLSSAKATKEANEILEPKGGY
jgi:hypothetical protein